MRGRNCCHKKLFVQIFSIRIPSFFWIRIRPDPNLQPREPLSSFMLAWRIKSTMERGTRLWFRVFASSRQRHFADAQTQMPIRNALPRKTGDAKFCSCLRKIDLVEKERKTWENRKKLTFRWRPKCTHSTSTKRKQFKRIYLSQCFELVAIESTRWDRI